MADSEKKKLSELRVKDLRLELGLRGLDKTGTKQVLMKRLEEALEEEGKDPVTFIFGEDEKDHQEDPPDNDEKEAAKNIQKDENVGKENVKNNEGLVAHAEEENNHPEKYEEQEGHEEAEESLEEKEKDNANKEPQKVVQVKVQDPERNLEQDNMIEENFVEKTEVNKMELSKDSSDKKQNVVDKDATKADKDATKAIDNALEQNKEKNYSDGTEQQANKECSQPTLIDELNKIKKPITKTDQDNEPKDNQAEEEQHKRKTKDNKNVEKRKEHSGNPTVIWISNISRTTRANELKAALYKCGKVISAKVVLNAKYPGSNCFGYVTMSTVEAVQTAIDTLNNTELNGRLIQVHKFDEVRLDQQRKMCENKPEKKDPQSLVKPTEKKGKGSIKPEDKIKDTEVKIPQLPKIKGRGDSLKFQRDQHHQPIIKNKAYPPKKGNPYYRENRSAFLNFEKIKEVRNEQQKIRDERIHRERNKKIDAERNRQKEIDERARRERKLIEKEKEELRIEKEKLEREKQRLKKLEQEQIQRNLIKKEAQALKQTINIIEEIPDRKRPRTPRRYQKGATHFEPRYNNDADSPDRRRPKFEPPYQGRSRDSSSPRGRLQGRERVRRPEDGKNFDPRNKDRYQAEFRASAKRFDHGPRHESPPKRREYGYPDSSRSSERGDWNKEGDRKSYVSRDPRSYNPVYNREGNSKPNNSWNPYGQIRYSPPGSWGYMEPLAQAMGAMQNHGYQQSLNPMGMPTPPAPSIGSYNNYGGSLRRY